MRFSTPLPARLLGFVVLPVVVVLAGGSYVALHSLEDEFERRMQEEVEMVARTLQPIVEHALERGRDAEASRALLSALEIGRVYGAYIYDREGEPLAITGRVPSQKELERVPEVMERGRRTGEYGEVAGKAVYSYFVPLTDDVGQILGLLEVTRRERDFRRFMDDLRVKAALSLGLVLAIVTGIVLLGYHGTVGRALHALRSSMSRVESGDHSHRAEARGPREVAVVATSFNEMLDGIARAEEAVRRTRQERKVLERQLRHSEKLAALGRLAAGVAHELGTPLSVINGKAQRALRDPEVSPKVRDLLDDTREEVHRMERIVRQLLDYGRLERRNRVTLRADQLAAMCADALQEDLRHGSVTLDLEGQEPAPALHIDPARAEQALINLLKNALQAAQSRVVLGWEARDDVVSFRVDDDGPGIPDDVDTTTLFEPFFTTKGPEQGTGLGLAIAHAVAEEHGTRVATAVSPLGGARFTLELPRSAGPREVRGEEEEDA